MTTIKLYAWREEELAERLGKLQAKTVKLGLDAQIGYEVVHRERSEDKNGYVEDFIFVRLFGEAPRLQGWDLKARIDYKAIPGSVYVTGTPTYDPPVSLREVPASRCDHCNAARNRHDLFVLHHEDGREVIVGRSCLRDYLGHHSPEAIVELMLTLQKVACFDPDGPDWRGEKQDHTWGLGSVLSISALLVRQDGYIKGETREGVFGALCPGPGQEADSQRIADEVEERDIEKAEAIVAWLREQEATNSYMANLIAIAQCGYVTLRTLGVACSAVVAYDRHQARHNEAKRKAEAGGSDWVGLEGERMDFQGVRLTRRLVTESDYGRSTLLQFVDANDNVLVWWASGVKDFDEGTTYNVRGTVKGHTEFRGERQTRLSRCKVFETEKDYGLIRRT